MIGVSVLRQPFGPYLTIRKRTCRGDPSAHNGTSLRLWETATAQFLP